MDDIIKTNYDCIEKNGYHIYVMKYIVITSYNKLINYKINEESESSSKIVLEDNPFSGIDNKNEYI